MNFMKLMELQKAGTFKITGEPSIVSAIVGGMKLSDDQCITIARKVGWTGRTSYCGWKMIDATNRIVRNLAANFTNEDFIRNTDISFESVRYTDSTKVAERIKLVGPNWDLTIIHGGIGLGGAYALFIPSISLSHPQYACSSFKGICANIESRL